VNPLAVFKTAALNHSATLPYFVIIGLLDSARSTEPDVLPIHYPLLPVATPLPREGLCIAFRRPSSMRVTILAPPVEHHMGIDIHRYRHTQMRFIDAGIHRRAYPSLMDLVPNFTRTLLAVRPELSAKCASYIENGSLP
jgi:hypothetical protein